MNTQNLNIGLNIGLNNLKTYSAAQIRQFIRSKQWRKPTAGLAPDSVQANLVILPQKYAFDFLLFCQRNPKSCPIIDVTEVGSPTPKLSAPEANLTTDIPRYFIYKNGVKTDEVEDLTTHWQNDFVGFLLGCSFTFETALRESNIPIRHIEQGSNVAMYQTNIACQSAGIFQGNMVVSMRPMTHSQAIRAVQITSRFPNAHGAPIHIGDPSIIGISNIHQPDFGDPVTIKENEIPVFWACGVTPQAVAMASKPELMITHAPGHMFITDLKTADFSVF